MPAGTSLASIVKYPFFVFSGFNAIVRDAFQLLPLRSCSKFAIASSKTNEALRFYEFVGNAVNLFGRHVHNKVRITLAVALQRVN